jgi:hypothetical protein
MRDVAHLTPNPFANTNEAEPGEHNSGAKRNEQTSLQVASIVNGLRGAAATVK